MTLVPLGCGLEISTSIGESLWPSQMLKGSLFSIGPSYGSRFDINRS